MKNKKENYIEIYKDFTQEMMMYRDGGKVASLNLLVNINASVSKTDAEIINFVLNLTKENAEEDDEVKKVRDILKISYMRKLKNELY